MPSAPRWCWWVIFLLALGSLSVPSTCTVADTPGGKKYALLIGVRAYEHARLPDLKYTENDVEGMARILARPGAGFTRVTLLTTNRGRKRRALAPTAANIRAALKQLLTKKKRGDTVLVALAGHGIQLKSKDCKTEEAFFCPSDAQLNDRDTLISLKKLFDDLDDCGAGVKLLLVDACRNDPKETRSLDTDSVPRPSRGIAALFSCSSGQRAFETAKLGSKGHGVFFHFVLKGLQGAAQNEDGEVTWDRLGEYVKKQVSRTVPRLIGGGARQAPHLLANITGESPVLVCLRSVKAPKPARGKAKVARPGPSLLSADGVIPPALGMCFFAVDQKELEGRKYKGPYSRQLIKKNRQVVLQAHCWLDKILSGGKSPRPWLVGGWVVAERMPVYRGEYAGRMERVEVPARRSPREKFVIATDSTTRKKKPGIQVYFGYERPDGDETPPEPILVDFEGGLAVQHDRPGKKPAIVDTAGVEVLFFTPDGRLELLEGARDVVDPARIERLRAVRARIQKVKAGK
jgi:hypothetical protein